MTANTDDNDIDIAVPVPLVIVENNSTNTSSSEQFADADGLYDDLDAVDETTKKTLPQTQPPALQQQQQQQQSPIPKQLSKWIQRLLHPELRTTIDDDIVIQSPQVIPRNDTYLLEFGQRVRDDAVTFGVPLLPMDIDREIRDNDDDNDNDDDKDNIMISTEPNEETTQPGTASLSSSHTTNNNNNNNNKKLPRKVKITNIKYTTSEQMIETILEEQFGAVEYMNLIMQQPPQQQQVDTKKKSVPPALNSGLAFITFVDAEAARQCSEELKLLDSRPVSVTLITSKAANNSNGGLLSSTNTTTTTSGSSNRSRYWSEIDLSIKCYTCGKAGHMSYECTSSTTATTTNATITVQSTNDDGTQTTVTTTTTVPVKTTGKPRKPCPLCANRTDHSEIYQCPNRNVCFNCGIPGHISRDCQQPRKPYHHQQQNSNNSSSSSNRCVCTICYTMNHHTKYTCPWLMDRHLDNRNHHRQQAPQPQQVHPSISTISVPAICASCGQTGHFLCRALKWFHGLYGVSCCNCGMPGHIGTQCPRPNLDTCSRNEETVQMEIERASTVRSVEQSVLDANLKQQQQQQQKLTPDRNNKNNLSRMNSSNGKSRYGSIDQQSRAAASSSSNNSYSRQQPVQQYDRGRQLHRQPQFRPFKSMPPPPPPPRREYDQQSNSTNGNNNNSEDHRGKHKRDRSGGNNNNSNYSDISPPLHKRQRQSYGKR